MRLFFVLIFSLPLFALSLEEKIEFLFHEIKTSNCQFERNFIRYTPDEAIEHIKIKYNYYKDEIHNIDDFIKLSATKSMVSGLRYTIICGDVAI